MLKRVFLIAALVVGISGIAQTPLFSQVVKVETFWQQCGPNGCKIVPAHFSGVVVGKTTAGNSIVLGVNHSTEGPAGAKFHSFRIGGKKAHCFKKSTTDDLALFWVEADLGKGMPVSIADAKIGDELDVAGYDRDSMKLQTRRGLHREKGVLEGCRTALGNSGGPVTKDGVVYGIVYGRPKIEKTGWTPANQRAHFVPATQLRTFLQAPKPIGGILFYNPLEVLGYYLGLNCPTCPPPNNPPNVPPEFRRTRVASIQVGKTPRYALIELPPEDDPGNDPGDDPLPPGGDSVLEARVIQLETKVVNLDGRVRLLETGEPPAPPQPPGELMTRIIKIEGTVTSLDSRIKALEGGISQAH